MTELNQACAVLNGCATTRFPDSATWQRMQQLCRDFPMPARLGRRLYRRALARYLRRVKAGLPAIHPRDQAVYSYR